MEIIISLSAVILGIGALALAWAAYKKSRECRSLLEFTEKQIQDLDDATAKTGETVGSALNRLSEQSRRVAWVESKIRKPQIKNDEVIDERIFTAPAAAPKSNIVERRHRILSLAARGQSSETIASTLGMMPGEVELIINLNRPALSFN